MEFPTFEHFAQGLRARDIAAFPVIHASVDDDTSTVRDHMLRDDFSHMPLRDSGGSVVRVIHRDATSGKVGRVYDAAVPLNHENHVVAAADPLPAVIAKLPGSGFLLVSSRESGWPDRIAGIINHADVVSLPVRLFIYTRTIQIENRVFQAIAGTKWKETPGLESLWESAEGKYRKGGERRACREAYLHFRDLMKIGQMRGVLGVTDDELKLLCTARNFACHAVTPAPGDELSPEEIPGEVEECIRLVEHLMASEPSGDGTRET